MHTQTNKIDENVHEVILTVTATAKLGEQSAFLIEVKQAGIFLWQDFLKIRSSMLGSFCPNILYPYAREAVTDAVIRAGFLSCICHRLILTRYMPKMKKSCCRRGWRYC